MEIIFDMYICTTTRLVCSNLLKEKQDNCSKNKDDARREARASDHHGDIIVDLRV